MEETLIGLLKTENKTAGNVACHRAQGCTDLRLENGFFFVHTTRGNATLTDPYRTYELAPATLAILTPSISACLHATTQHFRATLLYIVPSYFDSLPDSHPLYTQLSAFLATFRLPVIGLEKADSDYLQQTLQLFTDRLTDFRFYGNGMVRQLCSFLLLQVTELFCRQAQPLSLCVSRSKEQFREFKKLAATYYRRHHNIAFYADQLHLSTTYLSRIVRQTTGHTVRFHLSELICADARRLLECTDMEVKEIADTLGFSDQSAFGKFFAEKTGLSPQKYRQERERRPDSRQ